MTDVDEGRTVATPVAVAPTLTITVGDDSYTVEPDDAPITIGRVFPAQILVSDHRISRNHLRLEVVGAQWKAVDHSKNGVFLDGRAIPSVVLTDGLTLRLGNPEGSTVQFTLAESAAYAEHTDDDDDDSNDDDSGESTGESDFDDPGVARAGAAVAARRNELGITQRTLAANKVVNAGTLIGFEKGRNWPRRTTLNKIEAALDMELGTLTKIRWGRNTGDAAAEQTVVLNNTAQAPFMAEVFDVALNAIANQVANLPAPTDPGFAQRIGSVLSDLRRLEQVAWNASRSPTGAADAIHVLTAVRRQYRDLMLRAARSPQATLGQQLFAARHRSELSAEEAANAAGVSVAAVSAVEADEPVSAEATAALQALVASLLPS